MNFFKKYSISCISFILALLFCFYSLLGNWNITNKQCISTPIRTLELSDVSLDYQAVLNQFENAQLEQEGSLTTFSGHQDLDPSLFDEIDNLSENDINVLSNTQVFYEFSYDSESNIVTLTASMKNEHGEIEIDTISGAGFYNENGEIDAVMNIEGEGILLSEMKACGAVSNCGWFSKLVKGIAASAVVVAAAALCVATCGAAAPAVVAAGVSAATTTVAASSLVIAKVSLTVAAIAAGVAITADVVDFTFQGKKYTLKEYSLVAKKITKSSYYLCAATKDGGMLISPVALPSISAAVAAYNMGLSIYTVNPADAYAVATLAGNHIPAIHDYRHKAGYFNHYHRFDRKPKNAHAFYGIPVF